MSKRMSDLIDAYRDAVSQRVAFNSMEHRAAETAAREALSVHTPTPWSLCGDGNCSCLTLACPDHPIAKVESGEWGDEYPAMRQVGASLENKYEAYMERIGYGTIDQDTARANARFILKAVNNHDALVKALTDVRFIAEDPIANAERKQIQNICDAALAALSPQATVAEDQS